MSDYEDLEREVGELQGAVLKLNVENETLRAEVVALREANHQWLMSAMDSNRRDECFAKKYHGTPAIEGRHSAHSFSYGTESRYTGHCAGREG